MVRMESYVNACLELYPNSNLSYISTKTIVEIANFFIQDKISWDRRMILFMKSRFSQKKRLCSAQS